MFKSIEYCIDPKYNKRGKFAYMIVDSDFQELLYCGNKEHIYDKIIELYENKNLNPASNLALYIKFNGNDVKLMTSLFATGKSELWLKYKDDVEKYLLLI